MDPALARLTDGCGDWQATATDATNLQQMIGAAFGATHKRPVGDKWNNHGLMSTAGSFDYKLIENVTNMQDAVIERHALRKYGAADAIPYLSPQVAAADLFPFSTVAERARMVTVTFQESDRPTGTTKRLTPIFRDQGCGLRPESVPTTIFGLGGSQKDGALYQQGAFGLGGAMTFRNAAAVVLVSRRDPKLLAAGEQDLITVAVVQWQDNVKGRTAYYLVDQKWNTAGAPASPGPARPRRSRTSSRAPTSPWCPTASTASTGSGRATSAPSIPSPTPACSGRSCPSASPT